MAKGKNQAETNNAEDEKGFMDEGEEVLTKEEEDELKDKLKYYGYI